MSCCVSCQQLYAITNISFYVSSLKRFMLHFNWLYQVVVSLSLNSIYLHTHIIHVMFDTLLIWGEKRINMAIIDLPGHVVWSKSIYFTRESSTSKTLAPCYVLMSHISFQDFILWPRGKGCRKHSVFLVTKTVFRKMVFQRSLFYPS